MKTSDFMKEVTVEALQKDLRNKYGVTVDIAKYSKEQLESYSTKIQSKLKEFETKNNFNESLGNDEYQKTLLISKIVESVGSHKIQGIIVSNTTDSNRDNLSDIKKHEVGGLSGQPLKDISTNLIKKFYKETKGKINIIGVGGVDSGESAFEKITAGADAVQLYTGMVYKGPGIVKEIKKDLISILKKENLKNVSEAVGINA